MFDLPIEMTLAAIQAQNRGAPIFDHGTYPKVAQLPYFVTALATLLLTFDYRN